MNLGQKIKALRKEHDLTQTEFANKLGKRQPHIVSWEKGEKIPSVPFLKKISNLFNISIDLLVLDQKDFDTLRVQDKALLEKLKSINNMTEKEKKTIVNLIETFSNDK